MKKKLLMTVIAALLLAAMLNTCVFAQYYQDATTGISLVMSDDWRYDSSETNVDFGNVYYRYKFNDDEEVLVMFQSLASIAGDADLTGLGTEMFTDDILLGYNLLDDDTVADFFDFDINIKTESMLTSREMINNRQFFRIEKAYTGTADGYYPYYGYITEYLCVADGNVFIVIYDRTNEDNHFTDVYNMLCSVSFPQPPQPAVPGEISIVMNGEYIHPDSAPVMINDRVLVPIRAVAEKMGYQVYWNESESGQSVMIYNSDFSNTLFMMIDEAGYLLNDNYMTMDVPPTIIGNYTYIPLRVAGESLGAQVGWDDATQTVYLTY